MEGEGNHKVIFSTSWNGKTYAPVADFSCFLLIKISRRNVRCRNQFFSNSVGDRSNWDLGFKQTSRSRPLLSTLLISGSVWHHLLELKSCPQVNICLRTKKCHRTNRVGLLRADHKCQIMPTLWERLVRSSSSRLTVPTDQCKGQQRGLGRQGLSLHLQPRVWKPMD